jgi:hypothetical protein
MKKLLEVQKEIGTLSKNAKNPFFKSQYLDLSTLLQHVTPLLNAQGLIISQPIENDKVGTIIVDSESGTTLAESWLSLPQIADPQKLGSAITYFRRYTLKSLLAIAEEDDDGNKASKPEPIKLPKMNDTRFYTLLNGDDPEVLRKAFKDYDFTSRQKASLIERGKELVNDHGMTVEDLK